MGGLAALAAAPGGGAALAGAVAQFPEAIDDLLEAAGVLRHAGLPRRRRRSGTGKVLR